VGALSLSSSGYAQKEEMMTTRTFQDGHARWILNIFTYKHAKQRFSYIVKLALMAICGAQWRAGPQEG